MRVSQISLLFLAAAYGISNVESVAWDTNNVPSKLNTNYVTKFSSLPLTGNSKSEAWSDTYWPSYQGGIAYRWQLGDNTSNQFNYPTNTLTKLKAMAQSDINNLSPAEKYDIMKQRYDYPTVTSEWNRCSPQDSTWEGLCHGWAPASIAFEQPQPCTIVNNDGVSVTFGSSDIKALLTYYYGVVDTSIQGFVGGRCNADLQGSGSNQLNSAACADVNAGTFHIALANELGINKNGFIADVDRGYQVWNQPVTSFSSQVVSTTANGSGKTLKVQTTVQWAGEVYPAFSAIQSLIEGDTYNYYLDVDASGSITGGSWIDYDRFDFMWRKKSNAFSGYFSGVQSIFQTCLNPPTSAPTPAPTTTKTPTTVAPTTTKAPTPVPTTTKPITSAPTTTKAPSTTKAPTPVPTTTKAPTPVPTTKAPTKVPTPLPTTKPPVTTKAPVTTQPPNQQNPSPATTKAPESQDPLPGFYWHNIVQIKPKKRDANAPSPNALIADPDHTAVVLNDAQDTFEVPLGYSQGEHKVWHIDLSHDPNVSKIYIQFSWFNTNRGIDYLKIYEGEDGPVAYALHGTRVPQQIEVHANQAFIVFSSDSDNSAGGFQATYISE